MFSMILRKTRSDVFISKAPLAVVYLLFQYRKL